MLNSEGSEIYSHSFIELVWVPVLPMVSHSLASQTPYFSEEKERGSATPNTGTSTKQKNVARPIISFFLELAYVTVINHISQNGRTKMNVHG